MAMKRLLLTLLLALLAMATLADDFQPTGYLYVKSEPVGARVVSDGYEHLAVEAPALCTLTVGPHELTISMPYYKPKTVTVLIENDRVTRQVIHFLRSDLIEVPADEQVTLYSEYGELSILTDVDGAAVFVDDVAMRTPAPVTLRQIAAGQHRVGLQYHGLTFDTSILIGANQTEVLFVSLASMVEPGQPGWSGDGVPVSLVIDLPGCRYLRADERLDLRSNITISGIDAKVRTRVGDSVMEWSHQNLATHEIRRNKKGNITAKASRDTSMTYDLTLAVDDTVEVAVVVYAYTGGRFVSRDRLKPTRKLYQIPWDFNQGGKISVTLKVDRDGRAIFKYW